MLSVFPDIRGRFVRERRLQWAVGRREVSVGARSAVSALARHAATRTWRSARLAAARAASRAVKDACSCAVPRPMEVTPGGRSPWFRYRSPWFLSSRRREMFMTNGPPGWPRSGAVSVAAHEGHPVWSSSMVSEPFSEKFCRVALLAHSLYFRPMVLGRSGQLFREGCCHLCC